MNILDQFIEYTKQQYQPQEVEPIINAYHDFLKVKALENFKPSIHGLAIALRIQKEFNIPMCNLIKRNFDKSNPAKFFMVDEHNNIYSFHGLVLEFFEKNTHYELKGRDFYIG